ncbi:hypothetical protein [Streptomyces alfalfae]|uniref:hypothetical protein n=1 Tax=Streptomyces alfalfae TaxID=1642299 RepID=UPI0028118B35|nr:hypothetical protein [Streptomyces alfalfae]
MEIQVEYCGEGGRTCRDEPAGLRGVPVEDRRPLSEPCAYKGRRSILTKWISASGQGVWCSSTVQLGAAMLLDFDPEIVCFQSRVVKMHWQLAGRHGTVAPAFVARTRQGRRLVFAHAPRSAAGADEEMEQCVLRQAAQQAGWEMRALPQPQPVLRSSLESAAHFSGAEFAAGGREREVLLEVFATARPLREGAAASKLGLTALGYAWHLLWKGELTCDWSRPLLPTSLVWRRAAAAVEEA